MSNHKIVRVTVTEINDEKFESKSGSQLDSSEPWLCTPLTHFSDFRGRSRDYYGRVGLVLVEIETDTGIIGVGTCGTANGG